MDFPPKKLTTRRSARGQIRKISIQKLFGSKDYSIYVNPDIPTVLTGPNGSGKSTILRLLNALSQGNLLEIASTKFDRLVITFQDEKIFEIDKTAVPAIVSWDGHSTTIQTPDANVHLPGLARRALRASNYDITLALEQLEQSSRPPYGSSRDYRDARMALRSLQSSGDEWSLPEWFDDFIKYFVVTLINDKRLTAMIRNQDSPPYSRSNSPENKTAISEASEYIGRFIVMRSSSFGRSSQKYDQELPLKVMHALRSDKTPELEEILQLSAEIDDTTTALRRAGLLQVSTHNVRQLLVELQEDSSDNGRRVVAEILKSTKERFELLLPAEKKLNSLKQFLDRRLLDKELSYNSREGMTFITSNGTEISVSELSSGEQHLVMLAFTLLFICKEDSIVLIDEPEISLHVAWQDELLNDFISLGSHNNLRFIMASHSPTIIASMPDCEWPVEGF